MSGDFSWMSSYAPVFKMKGSNIKILHSPEEFYKTLKREAGRAKKRIVISSLYIGDGELERALVEEIRGSLLSYPDLQVLFLFDYLRAIRSNSRSVVLPLLREFGARVQVSLYHCPELRGLLKWILPSGFMEIPGVHHIKIHLFDNNLIIGSANLARSYFTVRQDRCMYLRDCGTLGEYCEQLVAAIASASFQLQPDDSVKMPDDMKNHPYKGNDNGQAYKSEFKSRVDPVLDPSNWITSTGHLSNGHSNGYSNGLRNGTLTSVASRTVKHNHLKNSSDNLSENYANGTNSCCHDDYDTQVIPLIQMAQFRIFADSDVTERLFRESPEKTRICLMSPYFNPTDELEDIVLKESTATFDILKPHPKSNSYSDSKGICKKALYAYIHTERRFFRKLCALVQRSRVRVVEYLRSGMPLHAKGLWYYLPGQSLPSLTQIGSSNYDERSKHVDLEAQFTVITECPRLQQELHEERNYFYKSARQVSKQAMEERHVPYWIQLIVYLFRKYL